MLALLLLSCTFLIISSFIPLQSSFHRDKQSLEIKSLINPDNSISKLKNYALNESIPVELREVLIDAAIREIVSKYDTELLKYDVELLNEKIATRDERVATRDERVEKERLLKELAEANQKVKESVLEYNN